MIWNKEMLYKILINISLFKDLFKGSSEILYKYFTFGLFWPVSHKTWNDYPNLLWKVSKIM